MVNFNAAGVEMHLGGAGPSNPLQRFFDLGRTQEGRTGLDFSIGFSCYYLLLKLGIDLQSS